jgi:hypothetical protein
VAGKIVVETGVAEGMSVGMSAAQMKIPAADENPPPAADFRRKRDMTP